MVDVISAFNVPVGRALPSSRLPQPSAVRMGWADAQRRRKEAEQAQYEALAQAKQEADAANARAIEDAQKARADEERRRNERAAAYQDNVDLYRPGGVIRRVATGVTREMLANSQKTQSPAMVADEALKAALAKADVEVLAQVIEVARAAGLRESAPNLKKAISLLATLSPSSSTASDAVAAKRGPVDPVDAKLDAIFSGGYAIPDDDDDDDDEMPWDR